MNCIDKRLFLEFCQCLRMDEVVLRAHTDQVRSAMSAYKPVPNRATQRTTRQIGETAAYFRSAPPLYEVHRDFPTH